MWCEEGRKKSGGREEGIDEEVTRVDERFLDTSR
jgi:hypothetical protein